MLSLTNNKNIGGFASKSMGALGESLALVLVKTVNCMARVDLSTRVIFF